MVTDMPKPEMRFKFPLAGLIILAAFALSGCHPRVSAIAPPLENEGEIYIYIQPMPQEADRLKFSLTDVTAVKEDGTETKLTLDLTDIDGRELKAQRLFAHGRLGPGNYKGINMKAVKATLSSEDGEAALLVPEKPSEALFAFSVQKKKSAMLVLTFSYGGSVTGGFGFTPSFTLLSPPRPVVALMGYVTDYGSNALTVFDKYTRQAAGVIATGQGPSGLAFDTGRRRAYVSCSAVDTLEVVDITTGDAVNRAGMNPGDRPRDIALTPDGRTLLVANEGSNTVSFMDPDSLVEVARVLAGDGPTALLMGRDGRRAFAFNYRSNNITVLDMGTRSVAGVIPTQGSPIRGQLNRSGDTLYVIQEGSPYMAVVDTRTLATAGRVYVGLGMCAIKVDPATDLIYISLKDEDRLYVFDPLSLIPVDYIKVGGPASYMAIDDEYNSLFIVVPDNKSVEVVNLNTRELAAVIPVLAEPYFVALMGERF